jgi:histidine kinase
VIRGRAEVLQMKNKGNDALHRDLETIIKQVDRIAKLMKSLLNLARGDEAKRTGIIDLGEVVREVLEVMGAMFRLHEIKVMTDIPVSLRMQAQAEHDPFHQIICNLFQNSIQAIERAREQGRSGPHEVRVCLQNTPTSWTLSVSDTGCGIGESEKSRLFRPFFSTKGVGGGLGLGLALTHRIVQSWKGSITVESEPGNGTTFYLDLPKDASISGEHGIQV